MSPWAIENAATCSARDEMDLAKRKAEQQRAAQRQMADHLRMSTLRVALHQDASVKAVVVTCFDNADRCADKIVVEGPGWSQRMDVIDAIRLADGIRAVLS